MKAVLLIVHVVAAIILIGPVTVAASLFPRYARSAAHAEPDRVAAPRAVAAAMHRITRSYAIPALAVPVSASARQPRSAFSLRGGYWCP